MRQSPREVKALSVSPDVIMRKVVRVLAIEAYMRTFTNDFSLEICIRGHRSGVAPKTKQFP